MMDVILPCSSPVLAGMVVWAALAMWIDGPRSRVLAGILVALLMLGSVAALIAVTPLQLGFSLVAMAFVLVLGWWLGLGPSNDRDWQSEVARCARAEIRGDEVTIHNLRNFDHENGTPRWETRNFDLRQLEGVDLFLCYWGPRKIAHTIVSFAFADQRYLPISIEARKEKGESYSAARSFFRQFELYYAVGDERDVIRLRTHVRREKVYLYRLTVSPEHTRALLMDYLEEINRLREKPRWYNALTTNCTTVIRYHTRHVAAGMPWNWRILANGYADELGYSRGTLDTSLPFAELRERSEISGRAREVGAAEDFSVKIREGLPDPRMAEADGKYGALGSEAG